MKSSEIRQQFLQILQVQGHTIVPSSSLVPGNDPTLLFTNSGMVQFKDVFTGKNRGPTRAPRPRSADARAGGKHNDLDQVGYTARHHTFFEMLGNWSFGDYFKKDAIAWAWELLTQVWKLPAEKLWVTVYQEDDEAYDIWASEIGVPEERIVRIGDNKGAPFASDNFWQMADTGPCGPCTEIFYDHGDHIAGGPPGSPDEDGDRFIEIWNLVFMQFERDAAGNMPRLPRPCVDTGMGLERIAARSLQSIPELQTICSSTWIALPPRETGTGGPEDNSLRVIADHIRACSFLIVDGVLPSNEGRGYVLRRIIRRALRHGYKPARPSCSSPPWRLTCRQDGEAHPGAGRHGRPRRPGAQAGRRAFQRNAGKWHAHSGRRFGQRAQGRPAGRHHAVHLVRHLRLPRGPDRRHLPRARSGSGHGRLRSRHGTPARPGARRGQVQDGRRPELRRRGHALRRLRKARTRQRQGHGPVRRRHAGPAGAGRPERGRRARRHAVLCGIGRPGGRYRPARSSRLALRRRRHPQDPGRRLRPPRLAGIGHPVRGRHAAGSAWTRCAAPARCATTPPLT